MTSRANPAILREDLVLYALLVVIGALPVIGSLVDRVPFGAEATLGLVLLVLGLLGLTATAVRVSRRHREA